MNAIEVSIPHGLTVGNGEWFRTAQLRPMCGLDESFLLEQTRSSSPAARTTDLLTRCLIQLGPLRPVTPKLVRSLPVGDREALLLHLRRLTVGDRLDCILNCPKAGCGEKMELTLKVSELLQPPYTDVREEYETTIKDGDRAYRIRFRLPTGEDQETAAVLASESLEEAVNTLLKGCIDQIEIADGPPERSPQALPQAVLKGLPQVMSELDPQAELRLNLTCPACHTPFSVLFDAADYLFRELAGQGLSLYREVHTLALHYHWSEAEILRLARSKRRLYLNLLAETTSTGKAQ